MVEITELPSPPAVTAVATPVAQEDAELDLLTHALRAMPPSSTSAKTTDELLADLNSHPLFMTDLEENSSLEALQALQYEGTPLEIATNFKEQGNEVFKIRKFADAKEFYTKGINVLVQEVRRRQAQATGKKGAQEEVRQEISLLEATLVNRAACHLSLQNYRSCTLDCASALRINPKNVKAYYRSSKALLALNRVGEADEACSRGLEIDPSNAPLLALAQEIVKKHALLEAKHNREVAHQNRKILEENTLRAAIKARGIKVRKTAQPPEMEDARIALVPDPVDPKSSLTFPTVLLYPLHLESDFVKAFGEMDTLGGQLKYILPLPWDKEKEYTPVGVECYMETITGGLVKVGKKVSLLKVLSAGNVEVVDEVVRVFVVPKKKAEGWIAEWKRKKALDLVEEKK